MKILNLKSLFLTLMAFCSVVAMNAQSVYMNQNSSPYISIGNSIACSYQPNGPGTGAGSYYRVFKISDYITANYFNVDSIYFGVEQAISNTGTQPISVNIYSLAGTNVTTANLTLLNSYSGNLSDVNTGLGNTFKIAIPTNVAGSATIVVEVASTDGVTDGHNFFIGSNNYGQTKPSYYKSACIGTDIVNLTPSYPNMNILISVFGRGSATPPPAMPGPFTSSTNPVCAGSTGVEYTVPAVAGLTYDWNYTGTGLTASGITASGNSIFLDFDQAATSGTLSVTAYGSNGTSQPLNLALTVNPGVFPPSVTKSIDILSSSVTGTSYVWYRDNAVISGATNVTYAPTIGGYYQVKVSDGACSAKSDSFRVANAPDSFMVKVNPVCLPASGTSFETYSVPQNTEADDYMWQYSGAGVLVNSNTNSVNAEFASNATNGTMSVRYNWFDNNTSQTELSLPLKLNITVNPSPVPTISRANNLLTATAGFASYQWYRNTLAITGATNSTYQMTQNGAYYVKVTSTSDCEGQSASTTIDDVNETAINDVNSSTLSFDLYPNPAKGNVTLALDNNMTAKTGTISITDISGRAISSENVKLLSGKQSIQINTNELRPGIYFVNLVMNDIKGVKKLIISK